MTTEKDVVSKKSASCMITGPRTLERFHLSVIIWKDKIISFTSLVWFLLNYEKYCSKVVFEIFPDPWTYLFCLLVCC